MTDRVPLSVDDNLLRTQGLILRDRVDALDNQLEGQDAQIEGGRRERKGLRAEVKALRQETDLYAHHIERLIEQRNEERREKEVAVEQRDAARARSMDLEAQVVRLTNTVERLQRDRLLTPGGAE